MARQFTPLQYFRALLTLLLTPLLTLLTSIAAWVGTTVFGLPPSTVHKFPRLWGKLIVRSAGVKVSLHGIDKIITDRPYIFAANHVSQFDIFALQGYLTYDFRWLAKKELFNIPIFGSAMRKAGYIPVDRARGRQALKSLAEAAQRIADGTAVIIFPEGTRSADGKLQKFKSGVMVLAIKSGVPIVPVGISGTYEILPKGKLLANAGHVHIRIGEPIDTASYSVKQKGELAEKLHDEVAKLLNHSLTD